MGGTIDIIAMIRELVPGREDRVERIFWSDEDFRTLCRDYQTCHATLERLRRADARDALGRQREYAELLEELAREIRNWPGERPGGEEER